MLWPSCLLLLLCSPHPLARSKFPWEFSARSPDHCLDSTGAGLTKDLGQFTPLVLKNGDILVRGVCIVDSCNYGL